MNPDNTPSSRLENAASYLLIITAILAPLAFWPTQYVALEAVKTFVICALTLAAIVLLAVQALKERSLSLPPRSIVTIGILTSLSIIVSSIASGHFIKSFFGQGFELGAGSFLIVLMLSGLVAFVVTARRADRAIVLYAALVSAFLLLWIFQMIRLVAGPGFATLGILSSVTSTVLGNWFSFGMYAAVIVIISFAAVAFLKLSPRMRLAYWALFAISAVTLIIVNARPAWQALFLVFLGLAIYLTSERRRPHGGAITAFLRRLSWTPLVVALVSGIFWIWGAVILGPVVNGLHAGYSEVSLPWTSTMDVAAGALKQSPLFGTGPNRFAQAYIANKPAAINSTDFWGVEFNSGFGLIPTFAVTQGFAGAIIWVLFFVFFGMLGVRSLRGLARDASPVPESSATSPSIMPAELPYARFLIVSSYASAAFIWLSALIYVPSHALVFMAFVMTGLWLGSSVAYGRLAPFAVTGRQGSLSHIVVPAVATICLVVAALWGLDYVKNTVALGYFGGGVKALNASADPIKADARFQTAVALNPLDVYWQARAEAGIAEANALISSVTATSTASSTSAIAAEAADIINRSIGYANDAIAFDPDNYNNYVSAARVAEVATAMKMSNGYEAAVAGYSAAIQRDPSDPSLYLSLARIEATQSKYDDAVKSLGAALQVKSNYLDAVYLLSQVEAAKGDLPNAITAAQFAIELNSQNPLLYFQLGLLQYNAADYADATTSLALADRLQGGYANAEYFLGLSYARLGRTTEAIAQFEKLAASNPDNAEVAAILSALRSGRSLFTATGATASAARPERRTAPPIQERQ